MTSASCPASQVRRESKPGKAKRKGSLNISRFVARLIFPLILPVITVFLQTAIPHYISQKIRFVASESFPLIHILRLLCLLLIKHLLVILLTISVVYRLHSSIRGSKNKRKKMNSTNFTKQ